MTAARFAPALVLIASAGALGTALISQYVYGLAPCVLCLYQRVPYVVTGVIAILALTVLRNHVRLALLLCSLAFFVNAGIGFYHVGVEQKWWAGTEACAGAGGAVTSVEDLAAALSQPLQGPRCDEPAWSLAGISMAGYNAMAAMALGLFSLGAARRQRQ